MRRGASFFQCIDFRRLRGLRDMGRDSWEQRSTSLHTRNRIQRLAPSTPTRCSHGWVDAVPPWSSRFAASGRLWRPTRSRGRRLNHEILRDFIVVRGLVVVNLILAMDVWAKYG